MRTSSSEHKVREFLKNSFDASPQELELWIGRLQTLGHIDDFFSPKKEKLQHFTLEKSDLTR